MKTIGLTVIITTALLFTACGTLNQTAGILTGNPSQSEIASGLKEALQFGTTASADRLSLTDGFFANAAVKILFPEEAQKVERTLRTVGLGKLADNVVLSINRAAEAAAKEAKPIFISAIKSMTIADAANILLGGQQDAATMYFKRVTSSQLTLKFQPVIQTSLNNAGATRYWSDAITTYNKIPLVNRVNPDLGAYVTQRAIDGLFYEIAREEMTIRTNLNARSTTLLQKVFGYADRNRQPSISAY